MEPAQAPPWAGQGEIESRQRRQRREVHEERGAVAHAAREKRRAWRWEREEPPQRCPSCHAAREKKEEATKGRPDAGTLTARERHAEACGRRPGREGGQAAVQTEAQTGWRAAATAVRRLEIEEVAAASEEAAAREVHADGRRAARVQRAEARERAAPRRVEEGAAAGRGTPRQPKRERLPSFP